MNKKSLVIFSTLFVMGLFFMSACENDVGSKRLSKVVDGGGGGGDEPSYDSFYFGDSIIMKVVEDSVILANGKSVTLLNVGSSGVIVVDVDGIEETIQPNERKFINGLNIYNNNKSYYDSNDVSKRWASLRISGEISPVGSRYYFFNVQDSFVIDGHNIRLLNVGSTGSIVVNVDGMEETITNGGTETVGNILITNVQGFYNNNDVSKRKAILIIG